jgi:type IV fimbrial biogenesis protein FimT
LGFSLIELLIAITIISIAAMLGIPSYRAWIQDTQIQNAANSALNGLQRAKAEAVKRNTNIEFVLGTSFPWQIQLPGNTALCPSYGATLLVCSSNAGAKNVTSTATPTNADTITFNNFGRIVPNATANALGITTSLSQIDFNSAVLTTSSRKLRVTVGAGGNVKMCDPDTSLAATDPRKC